VITICDALTEPSRAVCFVAVLRWLWLLPDWLAKWQSLVAYRRGLHRRHETGRRRAARRTRSH
jgi:hypothetical protein